MLVDIIFWEIEKFVDSASSFEPQVTRQSSIYETRNIFLPLFYNAKVENTEIGIHTATLTNLSFLSLVLLGL